MHKYALLGELGRALGKNLASLGSGALKGIQSGVYNYGLNRVAGKSLGKALLSGGQAALGAAKAVPGFTRAAKGLGIAGGGALAGAGLAHLLHPKPTIGSALKAQYGITPPSAKNIPIKLP